jgi:hypothetical protein
LGGIVVYGVGRLSALVPRWPRLIYGVLPLAVVGVTLALGTRPATPAHPHLTRQSVIEAALEGSDRKAFPRVEAKLMYRRDLQRADSGLGGGNPDELIWVVAVSGNYGISPSFGCCSVPRDYPGHNTWGLAIFVDGPGAAHANEFEVSYHGDWPAFFDQLPDLATA